MMIKEYMEILMKTLTDNIIFDSMPIIEIEP